MSEPFIGEIGVFGFNFAPRGWAMCDGQLLPISQNTALFALLGTIYGGDGRTTFGLPDLRGRVPIHAGTGPGLSTRKIGQKGGTEYVNLTTVQMPSHNHATQVNLTADLKAVNDEAEGKSPAGSSLAQSTSDLYSGDPPTTNMNSESVTVNGDITVDSAGGSQPHVNMQPFLVINFCIALVGLFPSRS